MQMQFIRSESGFVVTLNCVAHQQALALLALAMILPLECQSAVGETWASVGVPSIHTGSVTNPPLG